MQRLWHDCAMRTGTLATLVTGILIGLLVGVGGSLAATDKKPRAQTVTYNLKDAGGTRYVTGSGTDRGNGRYRILQHTLRPVLGGDFVLRLDFLSTAGKRTSLTYDVRAKLRSPGGR